MKFALRLAINFAVILVFAGVITVNASASTIPGDPLYGVKRTWEKVHLALTIKEPDVQQLQAKMINERRAEIEKVLQLHRQAEGEYEGVLEQISATQCVVSGMEFTITPQTRIEDSPEIGQWVELEVLIQSDGQLLLQKLEVEDSDYHGPIPAADPANNQLAPPAPGVIPALLPTQLHDIDDDHDEDDDLDSDDDLDEDLDEDDDDEDEDDDLKIITSPKEDSSITPDDQHDSDNDYDMDDDDDDDAGDHDNDHDSDDDGDDHDKED